MGQREIVDPRLLRGRVRGLGNERSRKYQEMGGAGSHINGLRPLFPSHDTSTMPNVKINRVASLISWSVPDPRFPWSVPDPTEMRDKE